MEPWGGAVCSVEHHWSSSQEVVQQHSQKLNTRSEYFSITIYSFSLSYVLELFCSLRLIYMQTCEVICRTIEGSVISFWWFWGAFLHLYILIPLESPCMNYCYATVMITAVQHCCPKPFDAPLEPVQLTQVLSSRDFLFSILKKCAIGWELKFTMIRQ